MTRATVCVRTLSFRGSQHPLDCAAINDEASRSLLGIVLNIAGNEPRAFLVGSEFAIGNMLGRLTKRVPGTMLDTTFLRSLTD